MVTCRRTIGGGVGSHTRPAGSPLPGVGVAVGAAVGEAVGVIVGDDADEPHWVSRPSPAAQRIPNARCRYFIESSQNVAG
jgi:hypothetical protein